MILRGIQALGQHTLAQLNYLGRAIFFLGDLFRGWPKCWKDWYVLIIQMYELGVLSLGIIIMAALFIGMVVALQGFHTLQHFGAEAQLGQLVALSVFRELGPVITGLLFAGRAGSSVAAEIGLMQITEQIDCMQMMAIDPRVKVLFPRMLAGLLVVPMLTCIFNLVSVTGGRIIAVNWLGIDVGTYMSNTKIAVDLYTDVIRGLFKSEVFALVILWTALYQGYCAKRSAAGVARAATKTVVYASLFILLFDFVLTALF
jgi:phospholipid/cholesterol/gamma-HCH transport system permease protein